MSRCTWCGPGAGRDTGITGLGALLGLSITSGGDKGHGVRCAKVRHGAHLNLRVTLGGKVFA